MAKSMYLVLLCLFGRLYGNRKAWLAFGFGVHLVNKRCYGHVSPVVKAIILCSSSNGGIKSKFNMGA